MLRFLAPETRTGRGIVAGQSVVPNVRIAGWQGCDLRKRGSGTGHSTCGMERTVPIHAVSCANVGDHASDQGLSTPARHGRMGSYVWIERKGEGEGRGEGLGGGGGCGGCWQGVPREGRKVHATRAEWDARVRGRGVAGRSGGGAHVAFERVRFRGWQGHVRFADSAIPLDDSSDLNTFN